MNEENETSGEKLWTAEFIGLSATNFFHFMAQYVLIVGLPICIMNEMKGGELEAGLAMTFFQIGTVACRPFAGRLIDRLHKGRLLFGATLAFFAVFALVILATRPFIGRIFDKKGADCTVYPGFLLFFVGFLCFAAARTPVAFFAAAAVLGTGFGALSPAFQTLAVASVAPERAGLATATYFWSLDISVGFAAATLGLFAANFGYATLYGILCPAVIVIALLAYMRLSKGTVKKKKTA